MTLWWKINKWWPVITSGYLHWCRLRALRRDGGSEDATCTLRAASWVCALWRSHFNRRAETSRAWPLNESWEGRAWWKTAKLNKTTGLYKIYLLVKAVDGKTSYWDRGKWDFKHFKTSSRSWKRWELKVRQQQTSFHVSCICPSSNSEHDGCLLLLSHWLLNHLKTRIIINLQFSIRRRISKVFLHLFASVPGYLHEFNISQPVITGDRVLQFL